MAALAKCCKFLELLHCQHCTGLTDLGVYQFALEVQAKNLRSLDLAYCRNIGDDALEVVAKKCVHLDWLSVKGLSRLTDGSIKALTHNLWKLQHLDLEDLFLIRN